MQFEGSKDVDVEGLEEPCDTSRQQKRVYALASESLGNNVGMREGSEGTCVL